MSLRSETKRQTTIGLGGLFLVACCIAGPAALGAIGGAATGSIVVGTVVAAVVALSVYALLRRTRRRSDC
jgi:hypothetical protein